jgi:MSHA biogenesis protein MshN
MSLINQMLQDLDKRGANGSADETMYAQIKVLPSPASQYQWWRISAGLLTLAIVLLGLGWYQILPGFSAPGSQITVLPPKAPLPVSSLPSVSPVVASTVDSSAAVASVPAMASNAEDAPLTGDVSLLLKLSPELDPLMAADKPVTGKHVPQVAVAKLDVVVSELPAKPAKKPFSPLSEGASPQQAAPLTNRLVKETTIAQQAEDNYRQATILQQQGRTPEAIAMLEHTLKIDTQHTAARQSLISLLMENKRYEEAIRHLQQALSADVTQANLAMMLARLQVEKKNVPLAIEVLQRSLPSAIERADYLAFLAALQQREAHHKEAADLYQKALRKNPQNGLWWMGLGISLQADGHAQDALEAYSRAKSSNTLKPELLAFVEQKITQLQPSQR